MGGTPNLQHYRAMGCTYHHLLWLLQIKGQLEHYKSDQFMKGVKLVFGRTNDVSCPVIALLMYLSH